MSMPEVGDKVEYNLGAGWRPAEVSRVTHDKPTAQWFVRLDPELDEDHGAVTVGGKRDRVEKAVRPRRP